MSSQGVFSGCGKGERFELTSGGLTGSAFDGKAKDALPWNDTLLGEILWHEPAEKTQLTRPRHNWMLKWLFKKWDKWERIGFTGIGTGSKLL